MINNCLNHDLPDLRIEVIFFFCFISFHVISAQAGIPCGKVRHKKSC